ncbi:hypothetical protein ACFOLC_14720 [Lysobacter cavernae]|uniref:Uncharacterized protein n=1 Tax=Lysobacter cavernae TaxID=1685901 RepID=A0ABV7RRW8_9GAMM
MLRVESRPREVVSASAAIIAYLTACTQKQPTAEETMASGSEAFDLTLTPSQLHDLIAKASRGDGADGYLRRRREHLRWNGTECQY